jgi:hypothetical protein
VMDVDHSDLGLLSISIDKSYSNVRFYVNSQLERLCGRNVGNFEESISELFANIPSEPEKDDFIPDNFWK